MVPANPPMVAPVPYPGGVKIKPPFEMGVANFALIDTPVRCLFWMWLVHVVVSAVPYAEPPTYSCEPDVPLVEDLKADQYTSYVPAWEQVKETHFA